MNLVYSLAIITAVIVLQSRSALLGIFSALVLSSMVIFVRQLVFRYGVKKSHLKIALLFAIAVLMFVVLADFFNIKVYDRFVDRFSHISSNSPRALLFYDVWYLLSDSIKNMLIGAGFMTTNPHNEVLRALSSTGLLGLFTYALFLYYLFMFTLKSSIINSRLFFSSLLIIVFTLVITQFYGYTKLLWVSWMFLLFNMVESKMLNSFRHCIGSSKYHRVGH